MNDNLALFVSALLTAVFVLALIAVDSFLAEINSYIAFFFVVFVVIGLIYFNFFFGRKHVESN